MIIGTTANHFLRARAGRWPAVLLLLATWACNSERDQREKLAPVVAQVNGEPIFVSEIREALGEAFRDGQPLLSEQEDLRQLKRSLLERLIDEHLLLQEARRRELVLDPRLVDAAVEATFAGYPAGGAEEQLLRQGMDMATFREKTRRNLLIAKLLKQEVTDRVAVSRADLEKYYSEHQGEFVQPEKVRVRQILVRTQEEAEQLRKRVLRGESFEQLAKESSLSPEASRGGDLGFFSRGQMPPDVEEHCFALFQPGQLSKVLPSPYGFHLYQLVEKKPAREMDNQEARRQIEERLLLERGREARAFFLRKLHENAKIERNLELLDAIH